MSFFLGFKISYILSKILTGYVTLFSCLADLLVAIISARKKKVIFCIVMSALLIGTFILYNSNLYNRVDSACNSDKYYFGEEKKGEANGNGRLFDNDGNLLYKGEFRQGKYSGEGKEYSYYVEKNEKTYLVYEGAFYDGNRNGLGKLYNESEDLIYEGCFVDGEKEGFGTEYSYDDSGKLVKVVGVFLNGQLDKERNYEINVDGELTYLGVSDEISNLKGDLRGDIMK